MTIVRHPNNRKIIVVATLCNQLLWKFATKWFQTYRYTQFLVAYWSCACKFLMTINFVQKLWLFKLIDQHCLNFLIIKQLIIIIKSHIIRSVGLF